MQSDGSIELCYAKPEPLASTCKLQSVLRPVGLHGACVVAATDKGCALTVET